MSESVYWKLETDSGVIDGNGSGNSSKRMVGLESALEEKRTYGRDDSVT